MRNLRIAEQQQGQPRRTERRPEPGSGSAATALLGLQRQAGNAAVVQRLLGQREGDDDDAGPSEVQVPRCGGAVLTGTSVHDGDAGSEAEPLSAGGAATQALTWADFADADENLVLDAQTGYRFSSSGSTFTAAFDPSASWAKPSAKAGPGQAVLLRHEQYHLDLAVLMAQKATTAGRGGQPAMNTLVSRCAAQTRLYDTQTAHGTNAAQQAAWEARIDAGTVPYG